MDIKDILSVGLTAEDFDTLVEAIDALPEKGLANEVINGIGTIMVTAMANPNRIRTEEVMKQLKHRTLDMQKKVDGKKDDWVILKSKLILLKRLLLSNDALREAKEILTPPPFLNIEFQQVA
jgi:hypothetical protein